MIHKVDCQPLTSLNVHNRYDLSFSFWKATQRYRKKFRKWHRLHYDLYFIIGMYTHLRKRCLVIWVLRGAWLIDQCKQLQDGSFRAHIPVQFASVIMQYESYCMIYASLFSSLFIMIQYEETDNYWQLIDCCFSL